MAYDWWDDPRSAPYHDALTKGAANSGGVVTPQQLANQIGIESSFNPNAVSSTGAIGIAQILPSTANDPGYGISAVDPTDANAAIEFAGSYDGARGISGYSGGEYSMADVANGDLSGTGSSSSSGSLGLLGQSDEQSAVSSALSSMNPLTMATSGLSTAWNALTGGTSSTGTSGTSEAPQDGLVAGVEAFGTRATLVLLGIVFVGGAFLLLRPSPSDIVTAALDVGGKKK